VGWEKVVCWSTKAALSLKRVQIEQKVTMGAYRNYQRSCQRHHPRPPTASPSQRLGFTPHRKLQSLLSQERVKIRTSNLARTITGSTRRKAHEKFWRKGSVGVSSDCPNFMGTPIISGTGKGTDFNFGQYIQRVHPNKSPLKILEKRERGRIQGLPIFSGTPDYLRNW